MEHSPKIGSQKKSMWHRKYATSKLTLTRRLRNGGKPQRLTQAKPDVYVSMDQRKASGWRGCLFTMESLEHEGLHKHLFIWNIQSCWVSSLWKIKKKRMTERKAWSFRDRTLFPSSTLPSWYLYSDKTFVKYFLLPAKSSLPSKKEKVTELTVRVIGYLRGVKIQIPSYSCEAKLTWLWLNWQIKPEKMK